MDATNNVNEFRQEVSFSGVPQYDPFSSDPSSILSRNFINGPISAIKLNAELIGRIAGSCGTSEEAMNGRVKKILNQTDNIENMMEDMLLLLKIEYRMLNAVRSDYKVLDIEDQLSICFEEYSACRKHRIEDYLKGVYVNTDFEKTVWAFDRLINLIRSISSGGKPELIVKIDQSFVNVNIDMPFKGKGDFLELEPFFSGSSQDDFTENNRASSLSLRLYVIKKLFNLADCQIAASKSSNKITFVIAMPLSERMQGEEDSAIISSDAA